MTVLRLYLKSGSGLVLHPDLFIETDSWRDWKMAVMCFCVSPHKEEAGRT